MMWDSGDERKDFERYQEWLGALQEELALLDRVNEKAPARGVAGGMTHERKPRGYANRTDN